MPFEFVHLLAKMPFPATARKISPGDLIGKTIFEASDLNAPEAFQAPSAERYEKPTAEVLTHV